MPPGRQNKPATAAKAADPDNPSTSRSESRPDSGPATKRPRRIESLQTQTKILDAAETLFMDTGFTATSFRAIARKAGVNLAAAHYHFGSKEGLFAAALHRRVAPLTATRLKALGALESRSHSPTARDVLNAYLLRSRFNRGVYLFQARESICVDVLWDDQFQFEATPRVAK